MIIFHNVHGINPFIKPSSPLDDPGRCHSYQTEMFNQKLKIISLTTFYRYTVTLLFNQMMPAKWLPTA